jgi:hypothetical protein
MTSAASKPEAHQKEKPVFLSDKKSAFFSQKI